MSVLLRNPDCVPALFSRAAEPEPSPARPPAAWRRLMRAAPFGLAAVAVLTEVPLVKAAAAAAGFAVAR